MQSKFLKIATILFMLILASVSLPSISGINLEKSNFPHEYYTYSNMTQLLQNLQTQHPDIMKLESLGKTYEQRDIWMVKISDNPLINEEEPGALLMGAHHGNEKPSYESLIYFIQHMVSNYSKENTDDDHDGQINEDVIDGKDNDNDGKIDEDPSEDRVRQIVDNTQIFILPMVNPDGVEYKEAGYDGWRKNRDPNYNDDGQIVSYGVDLNRNYDFKWELYETFPSLFNDEWTSDPESWNYRGEHPFSEKESAAVKSFVEGQNINVSLSYHSYGEFIIYPWMHTSAKAQHEDLFISVGEGISEINGYDLRTGSDYTIPRLGGTIGTSENWLYGMQGILSFTVELCKTRAPTNPSTVKQYCHTHAGVNMYICERASTIEIDGIPDEISKITITPFFNFFMFLRSIIRH